MDAVDSQALRCAEGIKSQSLQAYLLLEPNLAPRPKLGKPAVFEILVFAYGSFYLMHAESAVRNQLEAHEADRVLWALRFYMPKTLAQSMPKATPQAVPEIEKRFWEIYDAVSQCIDKTGKALSAFAAFAAYHLGWEQCGQKEAELVLQAFSKTSQQVQKEIESLIAVCKTA